MPGRRRGGRADRLGTSAAPPAMRRIAGGCLLALAALFSAARGAAVAVAVVPPSPLAPLPPPQRVDGLLRCGAERVLRPLSTGDVARMVSELYEEAALAAASSSNATTTTSTTAAAANGAAPPSSDPPAPPFRIRATHSRFHTPTTLACPGDGQPQKQKTAAAAPTMTTMTTAVVSSASDEGADARSAHGTGAATGEQQQQHRKSQRISLLTDGLDAVLEVQPVPLRRMRVQAGMTVGQLLAAATAVNLSVPVGALPSFSGLTLGGLLATAAHGSGPSTLADMVVEATWVDGKGKVHVSSLLSDSDNDGKGAGGAGRALVGGIGLTGVVTELLLQLTPPTLTHALVASNLPDDDLYADVRDLLASSPHVTLLWRPDLKRYSAWALYSETQREAERRRTRARREEQGLEMIDGGGGKGLEDSSSSPSLAAEKALTEKDDDQDDARATATLEAAAALQDARALLSWQRDVNLQGGAREEAAACAMALSGAPFAYPLPASGVGARLGAAWRRRKEEEQGDGDEKAPSSSSLLSRLRIGSARRQSSSPSSSTSLQQQQQQQGARVPATERFTAAFVGPTNSMAAAGCAPSEAAAQRQQKMNKNGGFASPLCAWAPQTSRIATSATPASSSSPSASSSVRATRSGSSGFHLALELKELATWIDDARWALEADLQDDAAIPPPALGAKRCLPPGGFVLRFGAGLASDHEEENDGGLADGEAGGDGAAEGEEDEDASSSNDDRDVRMDLAAAPDPAQLDDDARGEAADDAADAADEASAGGGGLLPLPPVLAFSSSSNGSDGSIGGSNSSSSNGTAAPAVLEVEEVSAAGYLSPIAGLKQPVYIQAIAATYEEEEGGEGEGGGSNSAATGTTAAAPPTPTAPTPVVTKYGWVIDALERFTYCAYNTSAPHWGDSSERALMLTAGGDDGGCVAGAGGGSGEGGGRIPGFARMLEAQRRYDPLGLFEPELFARVRRAAAAADARRRRQREEEEAEGWVEEEEGAVAVAEGQGGEDGCAADGRCWCTEDRHCAPGFGCIESNAFSGVMLCKPWSVIAATDTGPAEEEGGGSAEGGEQQQQQQQQQDAPTAPTTRRRRRSR